MSDGFPRKYSLPSMEGVSARTFVKREDAFQQLIGDGLLAMSGHAAKSYPTKGEDGSIDSFLENGASLTGPFANLPLPAVIECKDHDDSLLGVGDNILGGWAKVRTKLAAQAKQGWPDLFKPWLEARGYVYVVSSVIPTQDVRDTLERRIQDFFYNLPDEERPPIERIVVMDWNDARLWLDRFPDVRDSWLGTGVPSILSLDQYRAGLSGFRRFLGSEALPFIAPAVDSLYHPENLFRSLVDSEAAQGILLVGAGGVGKTRTSYEVALLAEEQGWRVLYVLPTDPPVTIEQLRAIVLSQRASKMLVIFEYLDQMPHLDIGALRRSLIPQARAADIHLVCLANSRPGFVWKPHAERDALFTRIELSLTSGASQELSEWIVKRTAPKACDVLSDHEAFRICGRRPIIALLVAQQLEKFANAGTLDMETVRPIREDDLLGPWLRRRLAEDELTTAVPQSFWETSRPYPRVLAAAAVLACAPDELGGLIAASASALAALHSQFDSKKVVEGLLELGWLERDGPWLAAVHDVVADEVVEQTLFERSTVRREEFEAMLSIAVNRTRSFGRIAKALSRVQGATLESRSTELNNAAQQWLSQNAKRIGLSIASEAPTHGSYALGAVFGGSVFDDEATRQWSALVVPWLERYDTDFEARHLLYRGLRAISGDASEKLRKASLSWLARWRLEGSASFVLAPLLHLRDLSPRDSSSLNPWAIEWLINYGNALESEFVLSALLGRRDLEEPDAEKAIAHALTWLVSYGNLEVARFVLGPLLSRKEPEAGKAIAHALAWLDIGEQAKRADSGFVLGPLLSRKEPEAGKAITHALVWLVSYGNEEGAQFVLGPLLSRKEPEVSKAITHALAWLVSYGNEEGARFVLSPLLSRKESETGKAITHALAWLDIGERAKRADAAFVLGPLLSRKEPEAGKAITYALAWLVSYGNEEVAQFVLGPLLSRDEPEAAKAVTISLAWLVNYGNAEVAKFVLNPLLSRKEPEVAKAIMHALAWLVSYGNGEGAQFVLDPLLSRKEPETGKAITYALAWLGTHSAKNGSDFMLNALLSRKDVKEPEAGQLITHALAWLDVGEHAKRTDAGFVLGPLLSRKEPEVSKAITHALAWLASYDNEEGAEFVLHPLLSRKEPEAGKAITHALAWLETRSTKFGSDFVLNALLSRKDLKEPETSQSITHAMSWLRTWGKEQMASFLLVALLDQISVESAVIEELAEFAAGWLTRWSAGKDAGFVLMAWFNSSSIDQARKSCVEMSARQWLAKWRTVAAGGPSLVVEVGLPTASSAEKRKLISRAHTWVRSHRNDPRAPEVLTALFLLSEVAGGEVESLVTLGLEIAWRSEGAVFQRVAKSLTLGIQKLPVGSPLRSEVEVCLAD